MEIGADPSPNQPTHKCSSLDCAKCRLLGRNRSVFLELFNQLDADKDGQLNAPELRGLFRHLFGDTVSNEHLLHFENRYLLQYGNNGCLSKDKFIAILEDYQRAHGYSMDEDAKELYAHFVKEEEHKIASGKLCDAIADNLPIEMASKLSFFRDNLMSGIKTGAEINMENFVVAVRAMFNSTADSVYMQQARNDAPVPETATIRHPFYRALLADKVARYETTLRHTEPDMEIVNKLVDMMQQKDKNLSKK